jgi:hypothetical protein
LRSEERSGEVGTGNCKLRISIPAVQDGGGKSSNYFFTSRFANLQISILEIWRKEQAESTDK